MEELRVKENILMHSKRLWKHISFQKNYFTIILVAFWFSLIPNSKILTFLMHIEVLNCLDVHTAWYMRVCSWNSWMANRHELWLTLKKLPSHVVKPHSSSFFYKHCICALHARGMRVLMLLFQGSWGFSTFYFKSNALHMQYAFSAPPISQTCA
jgi:hypothetical protein